MMRRSNVALCAAYKRLAPKDINDWSAIQDTLRPKTVGACFDRDPLKQSIIPTMKLQRSLFRLPIPKVEDTLTRYIECVKPLLTPKDYEKTMHLTETFRLSGVATQLQDALVAQDKANPGTSYISQDWFNLYLEDRSPLPVHYNPSLVTRDDPSCKKDGLMRAAFWIMSSVRFCQAFANESLLPDVFYFCGKDHYCRQDWFNSLINWSPEAYAAKAMMFGTNFQAFPLDMSQYHSLFNTTRIPKHGKDELRGAGFTPHIVVNHRGHQYKVSVGDTLDNTVEGTVFRPCTEEQMYARLKSIVDLNAAPAEHDVGVFTSQQRNKWAAVREHLEKNPENKKSFLEVDSAMFAVNLDFDTETDFLSCKGARDAGMAFLASPTNRWWDKCFSATFTKDGSCGIGFEHSWGDGVAVLRYTVDTFNDSIRRSSESAHNFNKSEAPTIPVEQLSWQLDHEMRVEHIDATKRLANDINRCDYYVMSFDRFGKSNKMFKGKVKPDPFMQVAMQLAWWRLNKSTVSTYESASTAAFKHGRTECIRSATIESQRFTSIFDRGTATADEKMQALVAATTKHAKLSKDAKMGQGIDRHLFALKKIAERQSVAMAKPFFEDPAYSTMGSNIISTSSLYSDALIGGGFGPVSPGYGVGYAAADDTAFFTISSWSVGGPQHSSEAFGDAIYASMVDMEKLIQDNPPSK